MTIHADIIAGRIDALVDALDDEDRERMTDDDYDADISLRAKERVVELATALVDALRESPWPDPAEQPPLFDPPNDHTYHESRLRHDDAERIYIDQWRKLNTRHGAVNDGYTYLEHILTPPGRTPSPVTRRDAMVAACVIQWLGTNCGNAFLSECERHIEQHHAVAAQRRTVFPLRFVPPRPRTRAITVL